MKAIWVLISVTGMFLLLIGGAQFSVRPARASEPKMDYWFIETLEVSDVELPAGVEILASNPSYQPRGFLILNNQTETPVYVMSLAYKDVLVMATPDPNWKARVNGAHEAASYLVVPARPAHLSMEALTDLDQNLVDRNVLSFDPPPNDVSIPAGQSSELLLVFDDQVIEVPFNLDYSLNTNFDNGSRSYVNWMMSVQATDDTRATATQQAEASAARVTRDNIILIGVAGSAVVLIVVWLVWRELNRRK